jgi:hypothetical protein
MKMQIVFVFLLLAGSLPAQEKVNTYQKPLYKEWTGFYNCFAELDGSGKFNEELFANFPFYTLENGQVWAIGNRFIFNATNPFFLEYKTGFTEEKVLDIVSNKELVYALTRNSIYELRNGIWKKFTKKDGLPKINSSDYFIKYDNRVILRSYNKFFELDENGWKLISDEMIIGKIASIQKSNLQSSKSDLSDDPIFVKNNRFVLDRFTQKLDFGPIEGLFKEIEFKDQKVTTCPGKDGKVWGIVLVVYDQTTEAIVATVNTCAYRGIIFSFDGSEWETYPVFDNKPLFIYNSGDQIIVDTSTGYVIINM